MFGKSEGVFCCEFYRKIAEEFVVFIVYVSGFYPCTVIIRVVFYQFMDSLVDETVYVVVVRSCLVDRQIVYRI